MVLAANTLQNIDREMTSRLAGKAENLNQGYNGRRL